MKNYLYIDDIRIPEKKQDYQLYIARNYNEAINALTQQEFDIISFDHDIGIGKTGYDIAKYIVENNIKIKEGFYIHSMNVVGKKNIYELLVHYNYKYLGQN